MKILEKSLELAKNLFEGAYASKSEYQTFHFAFGYERNRLIGIGQNVHGIRNAKAIKFSNKFGVTEQYRKEYLHAEVDLISKLWGRYYIGPKLRMVVLRLNKDGELCNSKPCRNCSDIISALNINKIWYSNKSGEIVNI